MRLRTFCYAQCSSEPERSCAQTYFRNAKKGANQVPASTVSRLHTMDLQAASPNLKFPYFYKNINLSKKPPWFILGGFLL